MGYNLKLCININVNQLKFVVCEVWVSTKLYFSIYYFHPLPGGDKGKDKED